MKSFITFISYTAIGSLVILASCKKDDGKDPTNPGTTIPQEQITTVILSGYNHDNPADAARQFTVKWEDLDGNGGNAPTIDSLLLDTGIEYHVHILLLDKTKTPFDTISNEVEELKNIHQFFYTPSASLNGKMEVGILDYDDNNPPLPVGLEFHMDTRASSSFALPVFGSLNIILSHYDGIPKTTTPSPESDIDITIPVRLK
jgi:hypothetical protein